MVTKGLLDELRVPAIGENERPRKLTFLNTCLLLGTACEKMSTAREQHYKICDGLHRAEYLVYIKVVA